MRELFAVEPIVRKLGIGHCLFDRVVYTTHDMNELGAYIREKRETLRRNDATFSLRQVAGRIGVEPSYLSKIERGTETTPSEQAIRALADELDEDPDVLLALAGKVSSDLLEIIRKRPKLFADLLRQLKRAPNKAVLRICREVRDGEW